jgi:hypothetical protein
MLLGALLLGLALGLLPGGGPFFLLPFGPAVPLLRREGGDGSQQQEQDSQAVESS